MLDLTNYDVNVNFNKPITQAEFDERLEKGLLKPGDVVDVYNEKGFPTITEYIIISGDRWWQDDVKMLQRDNWQNRRLLVNICKYREEFWGYMKENNIIPKDIAYEIENKVEKEKSELMEFWN